MENASKALIMAAGVLIGIMVLSLFVYLIFTFGSNTARIYDEQAKQQLEEFNSQFTAYDGREDLTIYDVVTLANRAKESNDTYDFGNVAVSNLRGNQETTYIAVILKKSGSSQYIEKDVNNLSLIQNELNELDSKPNDNKKLDNYSCQVKISEITKQVYLVTCTKK